MAIRNYLIAILFTIVISVSTNRKVHFYIRDTLYFYHMAIFRRDFVKIKTGKNRLNRAISIQFAAFHKLQMRNPRKDTILVSDRGLTQYDSVITCKRGTGKD